MTDIEWFMWATCYHVVTENGQRHVLVDNPVDVAMEEQVLIQIRYCRKLQER